MKQIKVGLLNDSFPPVIDGVANTVLNYAKSISSHFGKAVVATPYYPKVKDMYPFKVFRYPSVNVSKTIGYRLGNPYSLRTVMKLEREKLDILHVHSPFTAALLARALRMYSKAPIVFTYHTKFGIDIEKRVGLASVQYFTVKFILNNINAADEVWAVSKGAAEDLKKLGFDGEVRVMENGTDFARLRSPEFKVQELKQRYGISDEMIFLFVGRMMWYKNQKFTLDALKLANERGLNFKMFFVGDGNDLADIKKYARELGLEKKCVFTGAVRDREELRTYFTMADLFLFPSTYDTNGLVVREAAACDCPSLIIKGSCASEGIEDELTGLLIDESVQSYADKLIDFADKSRLSIIGKNAGDRIYLHWDDAVKKAYTRYLEILMERENHQ